VNEQEPIPQFETLAEFVADLRDRAFRNKVEAARYFQLNHATIGRYENGKTTPPLRYLLQLVGLVGDQLGLAPATHTDAIQKFLGEINKAIDLCYPGAARLRSWNDLQQRAQARSNPYLSTTPSLSQHDWELAPAPTTLVGREALIDQITACIERNCCRLILLLGMGGVGKTWLAAAVTRHVAPHFSHLIWRSLRNAPPLAEILPPLIRFLSDQQLSDLPFSLDGQLAMLVERLRQRRSLLVLDNLESILLPGVSTGTYRPGYEGYRELLRAVYESDHPSCLLLTSRERPPSLPLSDLAATAIRTWQLPGLELSAVRQWLAGTKLQGNDTAWASFVSHFSGNPLALQMAAQTVREQYGGLLLRFLQEQLTIFGEIRSVLDEQFGRLSPAEQEIMYWLTILREPTTHATLRSLLVPALPQSQLVEILQALLRRCWVEVANRRFGLQNMILEYLTDRLVGEIVSAIGGQELTRLQRHALRLAHIPEYIQEVQQRLLVQAVAEQLVNTFGAAGAIERLQQLKTSLQSASVAYPGYAGSNLLHLLAHLHAGDLHGHNFAHLLFRQTLFVGIELRAANFSGATFQACEWVEPFGLVDAVAFSPDGAWLAVGASNDQMYRWRLAADREPLAGAQPEALLHQMKRFEPAFAASSAPWSLNREQRVRVLAFAPHGHLLAAGYENGAIGVWETQQGQLLTRLYEHQKPLCALSFTADGTYLLSAEVDQTICIWSVADWACIAQWQAERQRAKAIAFHPQTPLLACGVAHRIYLWDRRQQRCLHVLGGTTVDDIGGRQVASEILCLAFSPDGATLASGEYHGALTLWDTQSGQRIWRATAHLHEVRCVSFAPAGDLLASASQDGTLRLWDAKTGECVQTLDTGENALCTVSFHPSGNFLASGAQDGMVRLWGVARTERTVPGARYSLTTRRGWSPRLWALAFAGGTRLGDQEFLMAGGDDGRIQVWDWPSGVLHRILRGHTRPVWALAYPSATEHAERLLASGSIDMTVRLWHVQSGQCRRILHGHTGGVLALSFHPRGALLASGGYDNRVCLWEIETGECLAVFTECQDTVRTLAFSPDGGWLAAGSSDHTVHLWNARTFAYHGALYGHHHAVMSLAFDPTGQVLASAEGDCVRLWNLQTGQCQALLPGCYPLVFHPTKPILFALQRNRSIVQSVDGQAGQVVHQYTGAIGHLHCLQVSPNGQQVFGAGEEGFIRVWDCSSGELIQTLVPERVYEQMNIRAVHGLSPLQISTLRQLGAVEACP
jgi:WD40 repeat protein